MRAPILHRLLRAGRRLLFAAGFLFTGLLVMEAIRIYALLQRGHAYAGYAFLGILALVAVWTLVSVLVWWGSSHLFDPPDMPADGARSHRELSACNRFLMDRLKRLAGNNLLAVEQQQQTRQAAYDIDAMLGHHPLNDDLSRSVSRTLTQSFEPAHDALRERAEAYSRERMRAVVNDVVEPAFPTNTLVMVYSYQLVLISRIVDIYFPNATLREYGRVLRDVANVVTRGRFLKLGQTLFAGVYSNSPPLGRAADTLGQAIISIWLTRTVSRAAILRCEDLRAWSTNRAVAELDACVLDMLADSKECILQEVLPALKQAIRHNAPPGVADAAGFSSGVIDGLVRAVDSAVRAHKAQPPELAIAAVRKTMAGDEAATPPMPDDLRAESGHAHRRRRRRGRSGIMRAFYVFSQRIRYTMRKPG